MQSSESATHPCARIGQVFSMIGQVFQPPSQVFKRTNQATRRTGQARLRFGHLFKDNSHVHGVLLQADGQTGRMQLRWERGCLVASRPPNLQ